MVNYKEFLFPYVKEREDKLSRENKCFAHYTSAENAINIIKTGTLWLRKASLMNDTQELILGKEILLEHLRQKDVQARLSEILRDFSTNIDWDNLLNIIANDEFKTMRNNTYLSSLTEIDENDNNGLLSMWRGYGHNNGVALVFNRDILPRIPIGIPLYFLPVLYTRKNETISSFEEFLCSLETHSREICTNILPKIKKGFLRGSVAGEFWRTLVDIPYSTREKLIDSIVDNIDKDENEINKILQNNINESYRINNQKSFFEIIQNIKTYYDNQITRDMIECIIRNVFYLSTVSIKHAGFSEEAEWRILVDEQKQDLYNPLPIPVEVINSIPQKVCKINFGRYYYCSLQHLLHKIIIGPCVNPEIVKDAFIEILKEKGFYKPENIIQISDIPLRT